MSGLAHHSSLSVALLHSDAWLIYGPESEENEFIARVLREGRTFLCLHYKTGYLKGGNMTNIGSGRNLGNSKPILL